MPLPVAERSRSAGRSPLKPALATWAGAPAISGGARPSSTLSRGMSRPRC